MRYLILFISLLVSAPAFCRNSSEQTEFINYAWSMSMASHVNWTQELENKSKLLFFSLHEVASITDVPNLNDRVEHYGEQFLKALEEWVKCVAKFTQKQRLVSRSRAVNAYANLIFRELKSNVQFQSEKTKEQFFSFLKAHAWSSFEVQKEELDRLERADQEQNARFTITEGVAMGAAGLVSGIFANSLTGDASIAGSFGVLMSSAAAYVLKVFWNPSSTEYVNQYALTEFYRVVDCAVLLGGSRSVSN